MIFLTVGTTKFPFQRMLKMVDQALIASGTREELVAQIGPNNYQFSYQNTKTFSEVSFSKMVSYLSRARVVITHGGAGTIFLALKYAKGKPLVFPRSKKFNEHVDDHQVFLAQFLEKQNLIKAFFPGEDLKEKIAHCVEFPEKLPLKKRTLPSRRLTEKLVEYTESIL